MVATQRAVILNLSASNITIGKKEYRHSLVANQSARCLAGYLYTAAGTGESTTDLAWDGHAMIYENGILLAESERFRYESHHIVAEIDLDRLSQERMRQNSFGQSMQRHSDELRQFRRVNFDLDPPNSGRLLCHRLIDRFPYVSADPELRNRRCYEAYNIQIQGLSQRLAATGLARQYPRVYDARLCHHSAHRRQRPSADGSHRMLGARARHPAEL